jgi:hypothetical protein
MSRRDYINRPSVTQLYPMAPTLSNHRISLKDFPTNLLPLLKLKILKTIILFALSVCYFKCTLVPEAFYEAKETRGENGEPLVTSGPYHLGPVVQRWISANPGLKFNPLF